MDYVVVLCKRGEARFHLRPARRRQGRAPLPYRALAGGKRQHLPPPPAEPSSVQRKTFYRCTYTAVVNCRAYITDKHGKLCPTCHNPMTTIAVYLPSSGSDGSGQVAPLAGKRFVQGIVTYTVLDDLTVAPMSAISSITLLNTFAVRDLGDLQEKTVQLGYNEGLDILKASLQSKSVLTDVATSSSPRSTLPAVALLEGRRCWSSVHERVVLKLNRLVFCDASSARRAAM